MHSLEWAVIALMIAVNAVFAAYEIALASVSLARLHVLEAEKRRGARAALFMKQKMEASLAVVQLGITLVGAIAAATGGAGAEETIAPYLVGRLGLLEWQAELVALGLVVVPLSAVTIVAGELVPKVFALKRREWVCLRLSPEMRVFAMVVYPAVWLLETTVRGVIRWTERRWPVGAEGVFDREAAEIQELRAVVGLARTLRLIGGREERIILGASRLSTRSIGEIVVPASQIAMLNADERLARALVLAHQEMHTRYAVCERPGDPQSICGYVNFKDLVLQLHLAAGEPTVRGIVRELPNLSADLSIAATLERMIEMHTHMVLVRDKEGGVLGMVTLEDILEELVGDIKDEYDWLPAYVRTAGNGWVMGGGVTMERVESVIGRYLGARPSAPPALSLSDWLCAQVSQPKPGSDVCINGFRVLVRKVRRGRVLEAQLMPREQPGEPQGSHAGSVPTRNTEVEPTKEAGRR